METTNFNNDVRDNVFFPRQAGGDKIVLVDMQNDAGINYDRWDMGGDMWDDLHPFETGYDKMADLWFSGLMEILPQADAGPDQNVNEFDTVTLDASGSTDPKSGNLSYQWDQTAGTAVVLSDDQQLSPLLMCRMQVSNGEILTFMLTVTDEDELVSTDTVRIVVELTENCPNDPNKVEPASAAAGFRISILMVTASRICNDGCPADSSKTQSGVCGCGTIDTDTDNDGTPDCIDYCPQ